MPVQGSKGTVIYKDDETEVKVIGDHVRITLEAIRGSRNDSIEISTEAFRQINRGWRQFQRESK